MRKLVEGKFFLQKLQDQSVSFELICPLPIHNYVTPYSTPFNTFLLSLDKVNTFSQDL